MRVLALSVVVFAALTLVGCEPLLGGNSDVVVEVTEEGLVDPDGNANSNGTITIDTGEKVEFEARDLAAHLIGTGEGPGGEDGPGVPPGGEPLGYLGVGGGSAFWTPEVAGTWTIFCAAHEDYAWGFTVIVE